MELTKEIAKDGNYILQLLIEDDSLVVANRVINKTKWDKSYVNRLLEILEHYNYLTLDPNNQNESGYIIRLTPSVNDRLQNGGLQNEYFIYFQNKNMAKNAIIISLISALASVGSMIVAIIALKKC